MSHELLNPLNAILGFTQLLLRMEETPTLTGLMADECTSDQARQRKELLETILHNGHRLLTLIKDTLDLSLLDQGRIALTERDTDPRALLSDCRARFVERAAKKGLALDLEIDAALPARVRIDPQRLSQILDQLLDNAVWRAKRRRSTRPRPRTARDPRS